MRARLFVYISVQVSTSTGVISHFVNLQVVVPEAFILGSGELHVYMGSTINLVCIIDKVSECVSEIIKKQSGSYCIPTHSNKRNVLFVPRR